MSRPTDLFSICISLFISTLNPASIKEGRKTTINVANKSINTEAKIQAAILLDVSNSMDGLIEQAKSETVAYGQGVERVIPPLIHKILPVENIFRQVALSPQL